MSFDAKINRVLSTFTRAAARLETIVEKATADSERAWTEANMKKLESASLKAEATRAATVAGKIRDLVGG